MRAHVVILLVTFLGFPTFLGGSFSNVSLTTESGPLGAAFKLPNVFALLSSYVVDS